MIAFDHSVGIDYSLKKPTALGVALTIPYNRRLTGDSTLQLEGDHRLTWNFNDDGDNYPVFMMDGQLVV